MMSTTRGNKGRGTPGGWLTAAGRGLAAVVAGLTLALAGVSLASAQDAPQAAAASTNQLQDIQVQSLPGDRIELRLSTASPELSEALDEHAADIGSEVLAVSVSRDGAPSDAVGGADDDLGLTFALRRA